MTSRDRRVLLLGGSVVLTAVLVLRVLPWAAGRTLGAYDDLQHRAALLARARDQVAGAGLLRDSAATLTRAIVRLAPQLVVGATAAEAQADLAGRVNVAASRSLLRLDRVDPVPDSGTAGRLARVRARAALEGDVRGLVRFLRAVEQGDALLAVDELRVTPGDPAAGSGGLGPEILRVEVTVAGWYLRAGAHGAGGASR